MAALGHECLLQSIALPVLYTTAQLDRLSSGQSDPEPGQPSGQVTHDEASAASSHQAVRSHRQSDQWRRDVALRALARIACVSSSLRQRILARLTQAIPLALAGAEPMCCSSCHQNWQDPLLLTLHRAPGPYQRLLETVPPGVFERSCSPVECHVCSNVRCMCAAEPSGAGLLDVLADAELLQQAGEAVCETIASTLLTAFSRPTHVRLRADTCPYLSVSSCSSGVTEPSPPQVCSLLHAHKSMSWLTGV